MFLTLLQRELLANLISFRFSVAVIICLMLVVTNTIVLIDDYESRLASYNTAVRKHQIDPDMVRTYSALQIKIDRPPNPLSIFNQGLDRRLGNSLVIYYTYVPALWDTVSHSADNPFLNLFSSIDLVFIFQVILSLLALLFAYDAVAGEREDGTLRLMLTTPISRGIILLAKYIAAMICLIVPLIISLVLALILSAESGSFNFSGDDWVRIGWHSTDLHGLPLCILPHRATHLYYDAPYRNGIDALNAHLGNSGDGLSQPKRVCRQPAHAGR